MPRLDGTGPRGLGSNTGRGLGNCNQSTRVGLGRGLGRGFGRGVGLGRGYFQYADTKESLEQEKKALEDRLEYLKKELDK